MPTDKSRETLASKVCKGCGETKPRAGFALHRAARDGLQSTCRARQRERMKAARTTEEGRAKQRAYQRAYRARHPERIAKRKRAFNDRYPEKLRAQHKVEKALRSGRLIRPLTCSACGKPGLIEAHHDDYSKPLDVVWLCTPCHAAYERRNQRGQAA